MRPPTHRAAGKARRSAVLEAAVEVIAEKGVSGATHRAIAKKAKVPLSTTSYFFASIDELITEAMRTAATQLSATLEQARADIAAAGLSADEVIDQYVDLLIGIPATFRAAEFEIYVQCGHNPQLQATARNMIASFEQAAHELLRELGAPNPDIGARSLVALADGFALQRFAWPRGDDDRRQLAAGVRALLTAFVPAR
ncbi:transcriptional regulator BetI [Mycobacteroides salmoniphilum]|nr:transcriptional regulator BetI [Mycobacteroides salmoniphilum]TDZ86598.1 transcriptional regulator BetI [Mycobacteroides salmoniphilum]